MVCYMVIFDILLSIGHKVLHEYLYYFHRQHHTNKGTIPASGWYMHWVDLMVELWIPIFVPPLLMGVRCIVKVGLGVCFTSHLVFAPKVISGRDMKRSKSPKRIRL